MFVLNTFGCEVHVSMLCRHNYARVVPARVNRNKCQSPSLMDNRLRWRQIHLSRPAPVARLAHDRVWQPSSTLWYVYVSGKTKNTSSS